MLSRCTVCGTPTDMALIDVATKAQLERIRGDVPLLGTCGTETCVATQVERILQKGASNEAS